jgi:hypothetical protein
MSSSAAPAAAPRAARQVGRAAQGGEAKRHRAQPGLRPGERPEDVRQLLGQHGAQRARRGQRGPRKQRRRTAEGVGQPRQHVQRQQGHPHGGADQDLGGGAPPGHRQGRGTGHREHQRHPGPHPPWRGGSGRREDPALLRQPEGRGEQHGAGHRQRGGPSRHRPAQGEGGDRGAERERRTVLRQEGEREPRQRHRPERSGERARPGRHRGQRAACPEDEERPSRQPIRGHIGGHRARQRHTAHRDQPEARAHDATPQDHAA